MKTAIVLLALSLAFVAIPAPAGAHIALCDVTDVGCVVECRLAHVGVSPLDPSHRCFLGLP